MVIFIKRFRDWLKLKSRLDDKQHIPPLFNEREVWWCYFGENLGVELCGKGTHFLRPVLILKKLNNLSFIGLPITKTSKTGTWFRPIKINDTDGCIILFQSRYLDYRRLHKKILTLPMADFSNVKENYRDLFV